MLRINNSFLPMGKQNTSYKEGDMFLVPLRESGYAIGLVAVKESGQSGGLGYFFGPKLETQPERLPSLEISPQSAVIVRQFGDRGIITGRWPFIGRLDAFDSSLWTVTKYRHYDDISGKYYLREYTPDYQFIGEREVDEREAMLHPKDGVAGAGFIEIMLTKLLS